MLERGGPLARCISRSIETETLCVKTALVQNSSFNSGILYLSHSSFKWNYISESLLQYTSISYFWSYRFYGRKGFTFQHEIHNIFIFFIFIFGWKYFYQLMVLFRSAYVVFLFIHKYKCKSNPWFNKALWRLKRDFRVPSTFTFINIYVV